MKQSFCVFIRTMLEDAWLVSRFLWWNHHPGAVGGARKKNNNVYVFIKYDFVVFVESKQTGMVVVAVAGVRRRVVLPTKRIYSDCIDEYIYLCLSGPINLTDCVRVISGPQESEWLWNNKRESITRYYITIQFYLYVLMYIWIYVIKYLFKWSFCSCFSNVCVHVWFQSFTKSVCAGRGKLENAFRINWNKSWSEELS